MQNNSLEQTYRDALERVLVKIDKINTAEMDKYPITSAVGECLEIITNALNASPEEYNAK